MPGPDDGLDPDAEIVPPAPRSSDRLGGRVHPTGHALDGTSLDARAGWCLFALFGAVIAWRALCVFRYEFDSDEWQHLHVAWEWTQGHVQYRDIFDNHPPLFHLLTAPLVALAGERADILHLARFAMFPIFLATLWVTYSIGRRVRGRRAGLWSAALLAVASPFFYRSLEFRPDGLWTLAWLSGIRVLIGGTWSLRRGLLAGCLLGVAIGISLKTSMLLAALFAGSSLTLVLVPETRRGWSVSRALAAMGTVAGGALVVPLGIAVAFLRLGALERLVECTITQNVLPARGGSAFLGPLLFLIAILAVFGVASRTGRSSPGAADRAGSVWVFLVGGMHLAIVATLWPRPHPQDVLPCLPLLALSISRWLDRVVSRAVGPAPTARSAARNPAWRRGAAWGLVLAATTAQLVIPLPVYNGRVRSDASYVDELRLLADVIRLTGPDDTVMDAKGESIFRHRPWPYVLESITRKRLGLDDLYDRIPEALVESQTAVAVSNLHGFPRRAREFLERNYVPVGPLRVLGRVLESPGHGRPIALDLSVGATYAVVSSDGPASGRLDGTPYEGPRPLTPGHHEFVPARTDPARFVVLWARAADRGFRPTVLDDPRDATPSR